MRLIVLLVWLLAIGCGDEEAAREAAEREAAAKEAEREKQERNKSDGLFIGEYLHNQRVKNNEFSLKNDIWLAAHDEKERRVKIGCLRSTVNAVLLEVRLTELDFYGYYAHGEDYKEATRFVELTEALERAKREKEKDCVKLW